MTAAAAQPGASTIMGRRRAVLLLAIVACAWGTSWPVTKLLLAYMPPLWTTATRSLIAVLTLFGISAARRRVLIPTRRDLPVVLNIALLHMVGFSALVSIGLQFVPVGRSIVLAYTTPIWVMIGARLFLHEPITIARLIGVIAGISGLWILFTSAAFNWGDRQAVIGNALVLLAAFSWAASILHVRAHQWTATPFELMPWIVLLATVVLVILASLFEGRVAINWDLRLVLLLVYGGTVGIALPYWATVMVNRALPATVTSLGLLGVPLIGVFCSVVALGERVQAPLITGMVLILGGIVAGLVGQKCPVLCKDGLVAGNSRLTADDPRRF